MSCADKCKLEFDATNHYASGNTPVLSSILTHSTDSNMEFRNYRTKSGDRYTDTIIKTSSISLVNGQYYKIRAQHDQNNGNSHFGVALEAESAFTTGHTHGMREIQEFAIDQTHVLETWYIDVVAPNSAGLWYLIFTNSLGEQVFPDEEYYLSWNEDPNSLASKIFNSYSKDNGPC